MTDGLGAENVVVNGIMEAGHQSDERTALVGFLQRQRDLVVWKVTGASNDVLRSVATPTGLTAHGLVRHLEHVERSWIRDTFAGQKGLPYAWTDDDPDGELHVPADITMAQLVADYRVESVLCDEIIAGSALETVSVYRHSSLRWILLHLIEETARHLGHLDLLRENADGTVGEDPN